MKDRLLNTDNLNRAMTNILNKRRAGILLHITSLPGPHAQGDLGQDAYDFVNFLCTAGITVWQTLPLGATHSDGSPYQCLSAHAGNPQLISIDSLVKLGWLLSLDHCHDCQRQEANFYKSCFMTKPVSVFRTG